MSSTQQTVAVVFGSRSAEHDISIITAIGSIIKPLRITGTYKVLPVYITKDGHWYGDERLGHVELFSSGKIEAFLKKKRPLQLSFDSGLMLIEPGLRGLRWPIDIVFPATHGTYGEDGSLQGLLRMASVPYVGCGLRASVTAMDKILTKQVLAAHDLPSTRWQHFTKQAFTTNAKQVLGSLRDLHYPLFVKPPRLGSSIGISFVTNAAQLENALELAFYFDDRVIVEEAVPNLTEVTVPVMGNHEPRVALVEEVLPKDEAFFDFASKYIGQGDKKSGKKTGEGPTRLPAKLPKGLYQRCEELALKSYQAIGASGTARIDLLIDRKKGAVYVNEINPLPGFLYAHNWKAAGVSNVELVEELIRLGFERFQEAEALTTTFSTNYLQQF